MKIELDKKDILNEIDENYRNDTDFLYEIIDIGTTDFESIKNIVKRLIDLLRRNDQLDINELLKD